MFPFGPAIVKNRQFSSCFYFKLDIEGWALFHYFSIFDSISVFCVFPYISVDVWKPKRIWNIFNSGLSRRKIKIFVNLDVIIGYDSYAHEIKVKRLFLVTNLS